MVTSKIVGFYTCFPLQKYVQGKSGAMTTKARHFTKEFGKFKSKGMTSLASGLCPYNSANKRFSRLLALLLAYLIMS
jgi:hypothetical protein